MMPSAAGVFGPSVLSAPASVSALAPSNALQPVATMKQLMLDMIHPASNTVLLAINRGGPTKEARALSALADRIDASCTTCHRQYRPGIFPNSQ
jgi:hypothetical protein